MLIVVLVKKSSSERIWFAFVMNSEALKTRETEKNSKKINKHY